MSVRLGDVDARLKVTPIYQRAVTAEALFEPIREDGEGIGEPLSLLAVQACPISRSRGLPSMVYVLRDELR